MSGIHERFERFEAPVALAVAACRMGWVGVGGGRPIGGPASYRSLPVALGRGCPLAAGFALPVPALDSAAVVKPILNDGPLLLLLQESRRAHRRGIRPGVGQRQESERLDAAPAAATVATSWAPVAEPNADSQSGGAGPVAWAYLGGTREQDAPRRRPPDAVSGGGVLAGVRAA